MSESMFRPKSQPAQLLYDKIVEEIDSLSLDECNDEEQKTDEYSRRVLFFHLEVLREALFYAVKHGLRQVTLEEIERADQYACGHTDYAAQFAYRVVEYMNQPV